VIDVWRRLYKHAPDEINHQVVNIGAMDACLPHHHCDPVNNMVQRSEDLSVEAEWTGAEDDMPKTAVLVDPAWGQTDRSDFK
jgi:hypothetical protein